MKPLRNFFYFGTISLFCCLAYSCVDESYDLEKADYKIQVLDNGISLPIGTLELGMDSILKVDETNANGLKVKGNMYYFSSTTSMNVSDLNTTINNFTLTKPSDINQNVNLYAAPFVPFDIPQGQTNYSSSISMALPNFSTDLIDVKRVTLKNTRFTMSAQTTNMGGNNLNNSISITCTPQDNVAEYYIDGVKKTSWTLNANQTKTIEIRTLDVTNSSTLNISCAATIDVATAGDVKVINNTQSYISIGVHFIDIDFETVYGKVSYSMSDSNTEAFDGFGELLNTNNNVLSFYNPTIKIKWTENLGVPINVSLGMSSLNSTTSQTAALTNTDFTMAAAETPSSLVVDSFIIDRNNGTANLFKINPTELSTSYTIQTDPNTSNHFISKDLTFEMESTFELPVQFGSDLMLNISDTITNPFLSVMDKLAEQENMGFGVTFDITNRIPLSMKIRLIAETEAGDSLFTVETDEVAAASGIDINGFATQEEQTNTSLTFTSTQVDQFKDVARFRVGFIVSASQSNSGFVTVSPLDYIRMNVAAVITGGVILDLNKSEE